MFTQSNIHDKKYALRPISTLLVAVGLEGAEHLLYEWGPEARFKLRAASQQAVLYFVYYELIYVISVHFCC